MLKVLMWKGSFFLTIAGLVLGAAGLALFNFGLAPVSTEAQTGYTTDWTATKLYQLRHSSGAITNVAAIGVAEWHVEGQIGTTVFSEDWSGPAPATARLTGSNCSTNGYLQTDWLLGCWKGGGDIPNVGDIDLMSATPDAVYSSGSNGTHGLSTGGGAFCGNGIPGCMLTTGSYGFIFLDTNRPYYGGLMMPLKWHVSGTIN